MNRIVKWIVALSVALSSAPLTAQTVEYIHTDALGSVVAVSDATGNIIERREYEPYGAQLTPVLRDGPGYTGHVQDAATGLTYMQQRYYDPSIGRFLSIDPVSENSTTGNNFNRYWYGDNNPYRFTDPDGRRSSLLRSAGQRIQIIQISGRSDASGSNDGDIDGDGKADGRSAGGGDSNRPTASDEAIDRLKLFKPPAQGEAGKKGELQGEGGEKGLDRDLEGLRETPGAKSKWTSLGKELIYLPDGRVVDKHRSTRPYADGPPENTPTIKIYRPGNKVPEVTIRYPEK